MSEDKSHEEKYQTHAEEQHQRFLCLPPYETEEELNRRERERRAMEG